MSSPLPYLVRMLLFMAAVAGLTYLLHGDLLRVFMNTPILNGVIGSVLAIGIFFVIRQVLLLWPEVSWLRRYRDQENGAPPPSPSRRVKLLRPIAAMLAERHNQFRLSPTQTRALLDGVATRLDERRELARYMIGLLIFLGLLGTFWGLLQTIGAVADAISGLQVSAGDSIGMFAKLKSSIEGPLKGMATAFGASLFGLSGSLVLGFLELQASQAQGRFHIELEEWLARATSLSSGTFSLQGGSVPAYVEALLERNAEGTDTLVRALQRIEESRQVGAANNAALIERLTSLADTVRAQQVLLARFTELSIELRSSVGRLNDRIGSDGDREAMLTHQRSIEGKLDELRGRGGASVDGAALIEQQRNIERQIVRLAEEGNRNRAAAAEELRGAVSRLLSTDSDREALATSLRNIEAHLAQLAADSTINRTGLAEDLRSEIRLLARTVASANRASQAAPGGS